MGSRIIVNGDSNESGPSNGTGDTHVTTRSNNPAINAAERAGLTSEEIKIAQVLTRRALGMFGASYIGDRAELAGRLGQQYGGDRDLYNVLGYKTKIYYEDYLAQYEREDIAGRIVDLPALDSWRRPPTLIDGPDPDSGERETPFVTEFNSIAKRLRLWHYLNRVDVLTGIGRYGVLLLGLTGEGDLKDSALEGTRDVIYLRPLGEGDAGITTLETDSTSSRFGLVQTYNLQLGDQLGSAVCDWSRAIHIVDSPTTEEIYGRPRLKRVLNRLYDLQKILGASAEALWVNMNPGIQAEVDPEYDFNPEDAANLEDELEEYYHRLRRFIRTQGVTLTQLQAQSADPSGVYGILIGTISAATGIPQRKLLGNEQGERASTQDEANWAMVIANRQRTYCDPVILRPFIERLIKWRTIPAPNSGEFTWEWPSIFEVDDREKAETADKWASAAQKLAPGGDVSLLIDPEEARERFLYLPPRMVTEESAALDVEDADGEEDFTANILESGVEDALSGRYADIDFTIPNGVVEAARLGLAEWTRTASTGGSGVGVRTARYLSQSVEISPDRLRDLVSYFWRWDAPGPDAPDIRRVADLLRGGDAGRRWALRLYETMEARDYEAEGRG